jgi:hypothetical protein
MMVDSLMMKRAMGMVRARFGAVSGLILAVWLASGPAVAQQRPSAKEVDAAIDQLTGLITRPGTTKVTVGSKNYDAGSGSLSIKDVKISNEEGTISSTLGSITADNLSLDQGGALAADAFRIADIVLSVDEGRTTSDKGSLTIPSIVMTAARIPLSGPKADANGVTDYLGWARGFAWSSFVVAKSSGSIAGRNGRLDAKMEVDEQNFGTLSDGVIDKAAMFGMRGSGKAPREFSDTGSDEFSFDFGRQEVEGLNFGAYALFIAGAGPKGERPVVSMMKKLTMGAIRFKFADKLDMTFEGAESGEILLRPMRIGYGELLGTLLSGKEPNLSPDAPIEELRIWGQMFEDMPDMMEAKFFRYKGLDMVVTDPEPVRIKVGAIEAENLKTVSYGRLSFKDILIEAQDITASLELFELRDVDFGGIYREIGNMARSRFVPNLSSIERNLPLLGKWEIKGVRAAKRGEGEMSLKRAALDFGPYIGVIPGTIDLSMDEFFISSSLMKEASPPSPADLGYDSLLISAGAKMRYDTANSAVVIGPIFASGKDMGTLTFNAQIGGVNRVLLSVASIAGASMNGGQSYLDGLRFDGMSIDVSDAELMNRLFAFEAKKGNKSLADMKAEAKDQAAIAIGSGPLPKESADKLAAAISAFIDNPASLRILVKANQPVTLRDFMENMEKPEVINRFSIEATANAQ